MKLIYIILSFQLILFANDTDAVTVTKVSDDKNKKYFKSLYTIQETSKHNKKNSKPNIKTDKKALFLTNIKNNKNANKLIKRFKNNDLYLESIKGTKLLNNYYYSLYIINLDQDEINYLLETLKKEFPSIKEESSLNIKYFKEHSRYSKYIKKVKQNTTIDPTKKAITIAFTKSFKSVKRITKRFKSYKIFVYKTKQKHYIMYAVNIEKYKLKSTLKEIKKIYKDAYIASDKMVKRISIQSLNR